VFWKKDCSRRAWSSRAYSEEPVDRWEGFDGAHGEEEDGAVDAWLFE